MLIVFEQVRVKGLTQFWHIEVLVLMSSFP